MHSHILGFPRIGVDRELKKALEGYWKGTLSAKELLAVGDELKERHWKIQDHAGLSCVTTGDFSFYDHVLDTVAMLGLVPERFGWTGSQVDLDTYFQMARGDTARNLPAMEMTKWFDANYHYLVPELTSSTMVRLASRKLIDETRRAVELGYRPKPVLLGPITFLSLGKEYGGGDRWMLLPAVLDIYRQVIAELAPMCEWIQIDEPILATDLTAEAASFFPLAIERLQSAAGKTKLLLATYFGPLDDNLPLAVESPCDGLHVDLVRGAEQLDAVLEALPPKMVLSAGLVAGRNIWKNDLGRSLEVLKKIEDRLGADRLMVGSSCSLLHSPVDLDRETELDAELKSWMAFAVQKCREVALLAEAASGVDRAEELQANRAAVESRRNSKRVRREEVRRRADAVTDAMLERKSPFARRKEAQSQWLKLPLFPTTTIGSFPQTAEIRNVRLKFNRGEIDRAEYETFLEGEIRDVVRKQEELGLDVLVHGESERNDMVEYFGQQMDGFCFTRNGWVQSYGSRCVKPPIIFGDISRPEPMTVRWITYAQSQTERPMKGMLTGPVTILCWSFVRDDLPRSEVCKQIALAVRDEVLDLEKAGVPIIQIDEAALREGLPLRKNRYDEYLRWAVDCFRLTASGVADATQIHTHMCYSEFNTIVQWIAAMDADVISIESSRSKMELLDAFQRFEYPNEIGPGVYDIHSPRVPTVEEMVELLHAALRVVPRERLWVNPDCGLKTRAWPETLASLENMVAATERLRAECGSVSPSLAERS